MVEPLPALARHLILGRWYANAVSAELIGILSVGVALAGLIVAGQRSMERRLGGLERCLGGLERRVTALEVSMEQRLSRLEGLLEGLGLSGRSDALASQATGD